MLPAQGLRVSNVGYRVCQWIGEASGFYFQLLWLILHLRQAFIVAQYGFVRKGLFACLVIENNLHVLRFRKRGARL